VLLELFEKPCEPFPFIKPVSLANSFNNLRDSLCLVDTLEYCTLVGETGVSGKGVFYCLLLQSGAICYQSVHPVYTKHLALR